MFFVKQYNVRGRQAQYKFVSKSNLGVVLSAMKYREKYHDLVFDKEEFEKIGVKVAGWYDQFIVQEDCSLKGVEIPAGTYFIDQRMQELQPEDEPLVKLQVPGGEIILNYEQWRVLRFEMDEMFLLQKVVPE